jgi:signal peptidase II
MFFLIIAIVLLLDQGSKAAVQMWMYQGESIPIIKQVFHLTYILNPGAAFGFLGGEGAVVYREFTPPQG